MDQITSLKCCCGVVRTRLAQHSAVAAPERLFPPGADVGVSGLQLGLLWDTWGVWCERRGPAPNGGCTSCSYLSLHPGCRYRPKGPKGLCLWCCCWTLPQPILQPVQHKPLLLEKDCSSGSAAGLDVCLDLSQTDACLLDGWIVCL